MKQRTFVSLYALVLAFFTVTLVSCSKSSSTNFIPLSGSGGGGGGSLVSATAVMLNTATHAVTNGNFSTAFNDAGRGIALWSASSSDGERILYSLFDPSTSTWSAAAEFYKNISIPRVASNGTGFMIVFWYSGTIYAREWSGGAFGDPVAISTGNCSDPYIISNGTGYCAAWQIDDSGEYHVQAARYSGTSWDSPVTIDDSTVSASDVRLATNGSGYCLTWFESSDSLLHASVYGAAWSADAVVYSGVYPNEYKVAGNTAGTYVILMQTYETSQYYLYANVFNGSTWQGATNIDNGNTYNVYYPDLATNGTTFCAVWQQSDGIHSNLYARFYDSGWGSADPIETLDNDAYYLAVASNGSGYCAAWVQSDGTNSRAYANRYSGGSWQGAEILNPSDTEGLYDMDIVSNGTGYMACWRQYISSKICLEAAVYSGTAWGTPAVIESERNSFSDIQPVPFAAGYGVTYYTNSTTEKPDAAGIASGVCLSGTWSATTTLTADQGSGSCRHLTSDPMLYRAGDETVAIWRQYDNYNGGIYQLFASVKSGSTWGAPLLLEANPDYTHGAASNGTSVCVTWTTYDSAKSRYKLMARIYTGGAWGDATLIDNDVDTHLSSTPYIAANASASDFCVAWYQDNGSMYRIYANRHTASGWVGPVQIDNTGMSEEPSPSYVIASESGYCAFFFQNSRTYAAVFDGTSWSAPQSMFTAQIGVEKGSIASSGENFAISFYEYTGTYNLHLNVYDAIAGTWSGASELMDYDPDAQAYIAKLAGDGAGGFCAAWYEYNSGYNVWTRIYDTDTGEWSDPEQIDAPAFQEPQRDATTPEIASNGTGYAVLFDMYDAYGVYSLYARVHDGISWLDADLVENGLAGIENYEYDIASNGSGYGVVWCQYDVALNKMIYGTVYDGASWSSEPLSNGEGSAFIPEVIWDGSSYAASWFQVDADDDIVRNVWTNTFK